MRDLETVVDAAGLDRFPLLGISQGGPVAVAYAVRHPGACQPSRPPRRVRPGSQQAGCDPEERELEAARVEIVRLGWGRPDPQYRQIFVARFLPEATQEEWREFDELQRRSTSPENAWRFVREFSNIDITDIAPQVSVPTLVACARNEPDNVFEQSRELASLIPGSGLLPLDSCNHLLPERDPAWPRFLAALNGFLAMDATTVDDPSAAPAVHGEARD